MKLQPYDNLKGFTASKPPLVIFMICLGLFAFVLLSLSFYVESNQIRNPDVSQDWNQFLNTFSRLEFCVLANSSEPIQTTSGPKVTSPVPHVDKRSENSDQTSQATTDAPLVGNYSVSMLLEITPTKDFLSMPHNITHLSGYIFGSDIGLKGTARDEVINITMEITNEWNRSRCSGVGDRCEPVKVLTCIHFTAQSYVFPDTRRSPAECMLLNETAGTGVEYSAQIKPQVRHSMSPYYCRSRPVIKVSHQLDAALSVWLSMHDKSVINLHLLHTSYFLFVMVIMLFCYALFRGRVTKSSQHSEMMLNDDA